MFMVQILVLSFRLIVNQLVLACMLKALLICVILTFACILLLRHYDLLIDTPMVIKLHGSGVPASSGDMAYGLYLPMVYMALLTHLSVN